jgi:diguanylate cyclase (GGDEF)-like protein
MKKQAQRRDPESSVLRGIDIFSSLSKAELKALSAKMRDCSYRPGEAIFQENQSGEELFVVASGQVSIFVSAQDGEEIELSRLGKGAFFGEMAILERAPRSASCKAVEATECLVLGAADFEALLVEVPSAAVGVLERMLAIAAGRLVNTGSFLSQMVQWGDDARKRAITDAATGLFNRRYLEDSFDGLVSRARREGSGLAYAMFDLDRFGKMNAAYGAEFCDRVILAVADSFRKAFGEEDILVRYGGDEFCFIVRGARAEAERKCGAVCGLVRELSFPEHPELQATCSIGLAHLPRSGASPDELKERADKALYAAKEGGRDRCAVAPEPAPVPTPAVEPRPTLEDPSMAEAKRDIPTIYRKNRVIARIVKALEERESFLIIGHKDPDEDCVSSMVAFALLANKLNKKSAIVLGASVQDNFDYLLKICRYNAIEVIRGELEGSLISSFSTLVLVDTPKPSMIDRAQLYEAARKDPSMLKIELDHHLEADSRYYGDPDYRLVYEASSTCEIIGRLAIKMERDQALKDKYQVGEFLTRNLVLAILSGMIGDSQMGRFLKSRRERWFYQRFSASFERMLAEKTKEGSGNFSSKEQVFDALAALSADEDACFRFMSREVGQVGGVRFATLDAEASRQLFSTFGNDTAVAVSKALVDKLAEESGRLGLVGYYDDPAASPFAQFRLRRSQAYTGLDLRDALVLLKMANGGGHPGAVGFRVEREAVPDMRKAVLEIAAQLDAEMARPPR